MSFGFWKIKWEINILHTKLVVCFHRITLILVANIFIHDNTAFNVKCLLCHSFFVLTSYRQCFDLEGEYGIVVRGIGTAVTLANALTAAGTSRPSTPVHVLTSSGEVGPGSIVSDSGCSNLLKQYNYNLELLCNYDNREILIHVYGTQHTANFSK